MSYDPNFPPPKDDPLGAPPPPTAAPPAEDPTLARSELTEKSGLPRNIAAFISCLFPPVTGIVFYLMDRKDRFVRFYALQAVVLGGFFLVIGAILQVSASMLGILPLVGWMFLWVLSKLSAISGVVFLFFWLILMYKAYRGQLWEMPILWRYAKRYIPQTLL